MVTWSAAIPLFWVITFWNLKHGHWGTSEKVRAIGSKLLGWSPTVILLSFLAVAVVAQFQLDVLSYVL
jgi:hypothetical protein